MCVLCVFVVWNLARREDGGRDGGRGGGCSGNSLCGGSGSGDGDSNVAATKATRAMGDCDEGNDGNDR